MMQGTIVKGIGGFYYVETGEGVFECRARGLFRKEGVVPAVGDRVRIRVTEEQEGYIEEILPRKNHFIRPPIANVDCLVVVSALKEPAPNRAVIDRFLVMAEKHHTQAILCFSKADLADEEEKQLFRQIYEGVCPLFFLSSVTGEGVSQLEEALDGKVAAFAGASGVGKSTLLNRFVRQESMETGEISKKSRRGKHTTRHAELFAWERGHVFDTPGFTSFDILEAEEEELDSLFPEFRPYLGQCRFDDCRHKKEPDCALRKALEEGHIHPERYDAYLNMLKEIQEKRKY